MKTKFLFIGIIVLIMQSGSSFASLRPDEGIVLDPITGNYTATYWDEDETGGELDTAVLVPSTKIDPVLTSSFKLQDKWNVAYRYRIANGAKAKQVIDSIEFVFSAGIVGSESLSPGDFVDPKALSTPLNWSGAAAKNLNGMVLGWDYPNTNFDITLGIKPGMNLNGFGFLSNDLPGINNAQLQGNVDSVHFKVHGEGPNDKVTDIAKQMWQLEKNNFVPRTAAVPTIAVPAPFDPAVTLERIQTHMHTWIGMQLLDAAFSAQLDRYLAAAADAYRRNQPKAGKDHLETLRKMLKKEQPAADKEDGNDDNGDKGDENDKTKRFLIDKLAARILDFDLKYVMKRMGGDKDE